MCVLGRLADTPALAVDAVGEVVYQTPPAKLLFGDLTSFSGWQRSGYYRWFTAPGARERFAAGEHAVIGAEIVADLRRSRDHGVCTATRLVRLLLDRSDEFAELWRCPAHSIGTLVARVCRVVAPGIGVIDLQREVLTDVDLNQRVVVYMAEPGSESQTKLKLSTVIGHHRFGG